MPPRPSSDPSGPAKVDGHISREAGSSNSALASAHRELATTIHTASDPNEDTFSSWTPSATQPAFAVTNPSTSSTPNASRFALPGCASGPAFSTPNPLLLTQQADIFAFDPPAFPNAAPHLSKRDVNIPTANEPPASNDQDAILSTRLSAIGHAPSTDPGHDLFRRIDPVTFTPKHTPVCAATTAALNTMAQHNPALELSGMQTAKWPRYRLSPYEQMGNTPLGTDTLLSRGSSQPLVRVRSEDCLVAQSRFAASSSAMDWADTVANDMRSPPALRWLNTPETLPASTPLLHHGRSHDSLLRTPTSMPYPMLQGPPFLTEMTSRAKTPMRSWQDNKMASSSTGEKEKESGKRPWKCSLCSRSFERRSNLRQHAEIHDPLRKRTWKCALPWCNDVFTRKHDAQRHLIKCHIQRHEISQEESDLITSMYPTINLRPNLQSKVLADQSSEQGTRDPKSL